VERQTIFGVMVVFAGPCPDEGPGEVGVDGLLHDPAGVVGQTGLRQIHGPTLHRVPDGFDPERGCGAVADGVLQRRAVRTARARARKTASRWKMPSLRNAYRNAKVTRKRAAPMAMRLRRRTPAGSRDENSSPPFSRWPDTTGTVAGGVPQASRPRAPGQKRARQRRRVGPAAFLLRPFLSPEGRVATGDRFRPSRR
jgi:hypothetical protein